VNAWAPKVERSGTLGPDWTDWATDQHIQRVLATLDFDDAPSLTNYRHERVGWGVVLPENEDLSEADRATACDAPPLVKKLVDDRHGVVLRYQKDWMPKLRRYYRGHDAQDLELVGTPPGVGVGELPVYLLILASPKIVSWKDQYRMSAGHLVGRLDLSPAALDNYITHLMREWKGADIQPRTPLVWSVDWGEEDITHLMRAVLADPVEEAYRSKGRLNPLYLKDGAATCGELVCALRRTRPAMIVTTSHGRTSPLDDPAALRAGAGLLVDVDKRVLDIAELILGWQPDGAIWYAHACCSAGTDGETSFKGLFEGGGSMDTLLQGIAGAGSSIAPLPQALLSAEKPARAFVGHVEPTFDWPLADPETGQPLSGAFCSALTERIYATTRQPIGMAFQGVHSEAGAKFLEWYHAKDNGASAEDSESREYEREKALRAQLAALDREGTVILGDPTVVLPS
jgi:hypothetical protein